MDPFGVNQRVPVMVPDHDLAEPNASKGRQGDPANSDIGPVIVVDAFCDVVPEPGLDYG